MKALREAAGRVGLPAGLRQDAGMLIVLAGLFVAVSASVDGFLTARNLAGLALSVSIVGMLSSTMLFCLAAGDFDLSVESTVALAGVLAAVAVRETGSVAAGIAAGVLAGGLVGLLNGLLIAGAGINALIATLATLQAVRGLAFLACGGTPVGVARRSFYALGSAQPLGVPAPVWIAAACMIAFGFLLDRTTFGRNALAIGGNREAAHLAGIAVRRTKVAIFALQGLMAGFAGVVLASQLQTGNPDEARGLSLNVISACVLGGVSLSGGSGTMLGTVIGVLIMGTVQNVLDLLTMPFYHQYLVQGAILLAAVLFDRHRGRLARLARAVCRRGR